MMEIRIKIEKKHVFFLAFLIVGLAGIVGVIAYGSGPPNVIGHSFGELEGVAPNCVQVSGATACQALPASWGAQAQTSLYSARSYTSDVALTANIAITATNANALGNIGSGGYCQSGGANCKAMNNANCQWRSTAIGGSSLGQRVCNTNQYMAGFNQQFIGGIVGMTEYYCCAYV